MPGKAQSHVTNYEVVGGKAKAIKLVGEWVAKKKEETGIKG